MPADYAIKGGGYSGLRPSHFYATSSDLVAIEQDMPRFRRAMARSRCRPASCSARPTACCPTSRMGWRCRTGSPGSTSRSLDGIGHMPQFVATDRVVAFIRAHGGEGRSGASFWRRRRLRGSLCSAPRSPCDVSLRSAAPTNSRKSGCARCGELLVGQQPQARAHRLDRPLDTRTMCAEPSPR